MAVGNTFGATALSSYGGFWLSLAIVLTPGGFEIVSAYEAGGPTAFNNAFGFFLAGWFIFTTILLICTLRSTVAFFLLFFFLDLAFLFLFLAHLEQSAEGIVDSGLNKAGGYFGLFAAFMAWYNALAGIADDRYVVSYKFHGQNADHETNLFKATPSSSFQLHTSHGQSRAASAEVSPQASARPNARPFKCFRYQDLSFLHDSCCKQSKFFG